MTSSIGSTAAASSLSVASGAGSSRMAGLARQLASLQKAMALAQHSGDKDGPAQARALAQQVSALQAQIAQAAQRSTPNGPAPATVAPLATTGTPAGAAPDGAAHAADADGDEAKARAAAVATGSLIGTKVNTRA